MEKLSEIAQTASPTEMNYLTNSSHHKQTLKDVLGDKTEAFRAVMKRLSAEYNWEFTKEDVHTWAEFASVCSETEFSTAVGMHFTDTSMTSAGTPTCTFRPKVGQIAMHIETIRENNKRKQNRKDQAEKNKQWKEEKAEIPFVSEQMRIIREKNPFLFKKT